jgi:hypothetical protein
LDEFDGERRSLLPTPCPGLFGEAWATAAGALGPPASTNLLARLVPQAINATVFHLIHSWQPSRIFNINTLQPRFPPKSTFCTYLSWHVCGYFPLLPHQLCQWLCAACVLFGVLAVLQARPCIDATLALMRLSSVCTTSIRKRSNLSVRPGIHVWGTPG